MEESAIARIYSNAQDLTAMVFGYNVSTDEGKAAVDNLLSSYQVESGGGYVIKDGVAQKEPTKTVFDSDKFFKDMDLLLGFGEGDLEGISTANLNIRKNIDLLGEQIGKNVFYNVDLGDPNYNPVDANGNVIIPQVSSVNMNEIYNSDGTTTIGKNKGIHDTEKYQQQAYNQHNTAINQAVINYEKKTREAIKDAQNARKPRNKASIADIRQNPDLLLTAKIPESKQRELADRAFYGRGQHADIGSTTVASGYKNKQALDNFSTKTLTDTDFLFEIDASDDVLTAVYENVTGNTSWQDDFIRSKYDDGGYKKFDFSAKKGKDLTSEQMKMLREEFEGDELKRFRDAFEVTGKTDTPIPIKKGPFGAFSYSIPNTSEVRPDWSPQAARQSYMARQYFQGLNPNTKEFKNAFNTVLEKTESDTQKKALEAYRKYATRQFNKANTTKIKDPVTYMKDFAPEKDAKKAAKALRKEMSNIMDGLGHDGIKSASKLKGLKVAGGIAGGLTALWALSEIYDE